LLGVCPTFLEATEQANDEVWRQVTFGVIPADLLPDGRQGQPHVGFDFPGFRGDPAEGPVSSGQDDEATIDWLNALVAVLDDGVAAYIDQQGG
jgi:hypothetical protein